MVKLFDKLTEDYFYVPDFVTDSDGNYRNARVKLPFGNYDAGDPIKLRFNFFDEKIFIDGKEVTVCLQIKN